jgi:hypothetical protein
MKAFRARFISLSESVASRIFGALRLFDLFLFINANTDSGRLPR